MNYYIDQTFTTAYRAANALGLTELQFLHLRNAAVLRNDVEVDAFDDWEISGELDEDDDEILDEIDEDELVHRIAVVERCLLDLTERFANFEPPKVIYNVNPVDYHNEPGALRFNELLDRVTAIESALSVTVRDEELAAPPPPCKPKYRYVSIVDDKNPMLDKWITVVDD